MDVYSLNTGTVALAAATAKTVAQVATPADLRARVTSIAVSFDGAASLTPAKVDVVRQTTAGTMSAATANPVDVDSPASQCTSQTNATVEPTTTTTLFSWYVTPNGGLFIVNFAPGEEPVIDVSSRLGVRINSPSVCNSITTITYVE